MLLYGTELAGYIKQQQFERIRSLRYTSQSPQLAIISNREVISSKYIQKKQEYGADIGIQVTVHQPQPLELSGTIQSLNQDPSVHGIVVQLPLPEAVNTDTVLGEIFPSKDVDGLHPDTRYDPPTPTAIFWLLSNYGVSLENKTVGVIGRGRLVGAPLVRMLRQSDINPFICDKNTGYLKRVFTQSDIVIAATGQPKLIAEEYIYPDTVIVDAGSAYQNGVLVGDVDPGVYGRDDIQVSPVPGGIGPLTVCALFGNVLNAFQEQMQ